MRVAVIRGDIQAGLALNDLESVSQYNPPTEPRGQELRVGRPSLPRISALLKAMGVTSTTAANVVAATVPVGGPVDVSTDTLEGLVGSGTPEQLDALANALAPHIAETDAAIKSFQVGMIAGALKSSFNPDPSRLPKLANGPALAVVQDDGVTPFEAPLLEINEVESDSPNAGDLTITGTNLGHPERMETVVRVTSADGSKSVKVFQSVLRRTLTAGTQGSLSATEIVIPASLLGGLGVEGSTVWVQYTSLGSNVVEVE